MDKGQRRERVAFTTDSYVVNPLFFSGGDIGKLAVNGTVNDLAREGLEFESSIESDCAPLADLVGALLNGGVAVHCLRDLTRGGLAGALNEIAETSKQSISIDESLIPVREDVASACEILGLDPLYVANEGRLIAFVRPGDKDHALQIMREHPLGREARVIGEVQAGDSAPVLIKSKIGARRILDMLSGEQLPRIC